MKKILLVAAITFSGTVHADNGFYTSLKSGTSHNKFSNIEHNLKPSGDIGSYFSYENGTEKTSYPTIAAAIGFDFSKISKVNARAELEYTYRDKINFQSTEYNYLYLSPNGSLIDQNPNSGYPSILPNEIQIQSLMLNSFYDFKNSSKFTPYVGVGVGVSHIKNKQYPNTERSFGFLDNIQIEDTTNNFMWSASLGVAYNVTDNVALDLGYRYIDAGKAKFTNSFDNIYYGTPEVIDTKTEVKIVSQDYTLGIRYNF